jgi:hypothetical protein
MVLANGSVIYTDSMTHPDLFHAARTNYGALGVLTSIDIHVFPLWRMERITMPLQLDQMLALLPSLLEEYERLQYYWTPYDNASAVVEIRANTTRPITGGCEDGIPSCCFPVFPLFSRDFDIFTSPYDNASAVVEIRANTTRPITGGCEDGIPACCFPVFSLFSRDFDIFTSPYDNASTVVEIRANTTRPITGGCEDGIPAYCSPMGQVWNGYASHRIDRGRSAVDLVQCSSPCYRRHM